MVHILMEENNPTDEEEDPDFDLRQYDDKKLNYMKLGQLLTEMGYIPMNIASDSIERELLFDMWNILKGEENNGVTIINIKKFLLSVQGISLDSYSENKSQPVTQRNSDEGRSLLEQPFSFN